MRRALHEVRYLEPDVGPLRPQPSADRVWTIRRPWGTPATSLPPTLPGTTSPGSSTSPIATPPQEGHAPLELVHSVQAVLDADPAAEALAREFREDGVVVVEPPADLTVLQPACLEKDRGIRRGSRFADAVTCTKKSGPNSGPLSAGQMQSRAITGNKNICTPRRQQGVQMLSTPTGSRTPVFELRTRRPGPLDDGGVYWPGFHQRF